MIVKRGLIGLLVCGLVLLSGGCSVINFTYSINVANYSQRGIVIQRISPGISGGQLPKYRAYFPIKLGNKGFPDTRDSQFFLGSFRDFTYSLPEKMYVAWLESDMVNCKVDDPKRMLKLGCEMANYGPVQWKWIDLTGYTDHPFVKQAGSSVKGGSGVYAVRFLLEFKDDGLELVLQQYQTNPAH